MSRENSPVTNTNNEYIPKKRREEVWDKWIGESVGVADCLLCLKNPMKQGACNGWDCGHVISRWAGGNTSVYNLRPICKGCNSSMGKRNMMDYCEIYEKESPILKTFEGISIDEMTCRSSGKCVVCDVNDKYVDPETNVEMLYCGKACKQKADEVNMSDTEENLTCKYCNKTFQTKHGLKKHLISAEKCLKMRGEKVDKVICEYCERKIVKEEVETHACKKKILAFSNKGFLAEEPKLLTNNETEEPLKKEITPKKPSGISAGVTIELNKPERIIYLEKKVREMEYTIKLLSDKLELLETKILTFQSNI